MRKLLVSLLVAAAPMPAMAATTIFTPDSYGIPTGYNLFTSFDSAAGLSGNPAGYGLVTGSTPIAKALPGNGSQYLAVYMGGSVTVNFAQSDNAQAFSFDFGTVDLYNQITVSYFGNGVADELITGGDVLPGASGRTSGSLVVLGNGNLIRSVTFASLMPSFELDNLAIGQLSTAVPEPASWAMMLSGFGLIGYALRRRATRALPQAA